MDDHIHDWASLDIEPFADGVYTYETCGHDGWVTAGRPAVACQSTRTTMYVVDDVQPDGADHDIELTDEQRRRARQRAIRAVASGNVIDFMPGDGVTDRQFGVVVGGDNGFQPMVYVTFERESRQVYGQ